jgi:hypothetical protein
MKSKSRVSIRASSIHGQGLVSNTKWKQGDCVDISSEHTRHINDAARPVMLKHDWSDIRRALQLYETTSKQNANVQLIADASSRTICALKPIEKGTELTRHYGIFMWCTLLMYEIRQNLELPDSKMASIDPQSVKTIKLRTEHLVNTAQMYYDISISRRLTVQESDITTLTKLKQNYQSRFPDDVFYWIPRLDGRFDLYMFRQS